MSLAKSAPTACRKFFPVGPLGAEMATYQQYEFEKQLWLRLNPDSTHDQIELAFQSIARRLGL